MITAGKDFGEMQIEKRMTDEAKMILKSSHDNANTNIVKLLGITKWEGSVGLVMEYMAYGSLETVVFKYTVPELFWDVRMFIVNQLVNGINYMHCLKIPIVHGDLKPENVLLTNGLVTKIGDFGASAMASCTGSTMQGSATSGNARGGNYQHTIAYTPPEVLKNAFTRRKPTIDVYSFGIILYEIIVRERAFPAQSMHYRDIFEAAICEGQRPDMDFVKEIGETVEQEDKLKFDFMVSLVTECWSQQASRRPVLKSVLENIAQLPKSADLERHIQDVEGHLQSETKNIQRNINLTDFQINHVAEQSESGSNSETPQMGSTEHSDNIGSNTNSTGGMPSSGTNQDSYSNEKDQKQPQGTSTLFSVFESTTVDDTESVGDILERLAEEEDGEQSIQRGDYQHAIDVFQKMISNSNNPVKISLLRLKIALCLNKIGDRQKGDEQLYAGLKTWSGSLSQNENDQKQQIEQLMRSADQYRHMGSDMRALMIYQQAAEKYKNLKSPEHSLSGVVVCISKIKKMFREKMSSGKAAPVIKDLAKWLTRVSKPNPRLLAKGLHDVANFFSHGSENELALTYYKMAVDKMEELFKDKAFTMNLYAQCLHNRGVVLKSMEKYEEAEDHFERSVKFYEQSTDFDSEDDKQETLRQSRDSLRRVRQQQGKKPVF
ncbi:uncharacterized protein LOC100185457 [Ciona intestinalis]